MSDWYDKLADEIIYGHKAGRTRSHDYIWGSPDELAAYLRERCVPREALGLVLTGESASLVLDRIDNPRSPTPALLKLMKSKPNPEFSEAFKQAQEALKQIGNRKPRKMTTRREGARSYLVEEEDE